MSAALMIIGGQRNDRPRGSIGWSPPGWDTDCARNRVTHSNADPQRPSSAGHDIARNAYRSPTAKKTTLLAAAQTLFLRSTNTPSSRWIVGSHSPDVDVGSTATSGPYVPVHRDRLPKPDHTDGCRAAYDDARHGHLPLALSRRCPAGSPACLPLLDLGRHAATGAFFKCVTGTR